MECVHVETSLLVRGEKESLFVCHRKCWAVTPLWTLYCVFGSRSVPANCLEHAQVARRINMFDRTSTTMTPRNVEDFDIWVFEARDLIASVVPLRAPWSAAVENYQLDEPAD